MRGCVLFLAMFSQKAAKVVIITYKGEHERAVLTVLRITQNGMREGCDKNGTMTDPTFSGSVRAPSGSFVVVALIILSTRVPGTGSFVVRIPKSTK